MCVSVCVHNAGQIKISKLDHNPIFVFQLRTRDADPALLDQTVKRKFRRLYDPRPDVRPTKRGLMELRTENGWALHWFVLDDRTHSLSCYSAEANAETTTALDTLFLDHLLGVAAIPFEALHDDPDQARMI